TITHQHVKPHTITLPFTPFNQFWPKNFLLNYFNNLLPDSEGIRRRLAMRYKADSLEPFDLLTELGKDCVGAIQLLHDGDEPTDLYSVKYHPLTESEIAATLRNTT
ncbi:HipA N-terminal domain-containing protein, partial [Escherichia coli]|nr:HipA N-terminal domain-containing protein [Escherichia coli]